MQKMTYIIQKIILGSFIVVATATIGFLLYFMFWPTHYPADKADYPLGDKLEYIGKEHYGCYGFCGSAPSSVLYYATDMSKEEIKSYFKKAKYKKTNVVGGGSADYSFENLSFFPLDGSQGFSFELYNNKKVLDKGNFKQTSKQHILSLSYGSYDAAYRNL